MSTKIEPVVWRVQTHTLGGSPEYHYNTQGQGQPLYAAPPAPDAEDAARYRWLRVRINSIQLWPAEKALDAMIDAAINARFDAARGERND